MIVVLLGASGVVIRLWSHGDDARLSAAALLAGAVIWQALLGRRTRSRAPLWWPAAVGLVVLTAAATVPSVGRAPLLVMLMSVATAHVVVVAPTPSRHWPARRVAVAALAVPPVVLAQLSWIRRGSLSITLALLVGSLVVVASYHHRPAVMDRLDGAARRGVALVAAALGALALLVVAVPVFYLPGAIGRLVGAGPLGRRRRSSTGSNWLPATGESAHVVDGARLPFISPEPGTARRRHLGSLAAAVVVGLLAGGIIMLTRSEGTVRPAPSGATASAAREADQLDLLESVPYSERPAMKGVEHADALQADLAEAVLIPDPIAGYVTADTATTYVNVERGIRRTVQSSCVGCPQVDLWLVGASTVFGVGQRDDQTIGSALVRLAAERGIDLRVTSVSAPGWTLHQEANWLRHQLDLAAEQPDLVVFVDGFNDVTSAVARVVAGHGSSTDPLVFDQDQMVSALSATEELGPARADAAVEVAVSNYRAEQRAISADLESRGIPYQFFFQPDAFASRRQLGPVLDTYDVAPRLLASGELGDVVASAVDRLSPWTEDLRGIYESEAAPLFIDVVHTNEDGASRVAAAVFDTVLPDLEELVADT